MVWTWLDCWLPSGTENVLWQCSVCSLDETVMSEQHEWDSKVCQSKPWGNMCVFKVSARPVIVLAGVTCNSLLPHRLPLSWLTIKNNLVYTRILTLHHNSWSASGNWNSPQSAIGAGLGALGAKAGVTLPSTWLSRPEHLSGQLPFRCWRNSEVKTQGTGGV